MAGAELDSACAFFRGRVWWTHGSPFAAAAAAECLQLRQPPTPAWHAVEGSGKD